MVQLHSQHSGGQFDGVSRTGSARLPLRNIYVIFNVVIELAGDSRSKCVEMNE